MPASMEACGVRAASIGAPPPGVSHATSSIVARSRTNGSLGSCWRNVRTMARSSVTSPGELRKTRIRGSNTSACFHGVPRLGLEDDHRPEHLAPLHPVERLLDVADADAFAHELVEREPALEEQLDERGEVA